jgi:hypothetical protein
LNQKFNSFDIEQADSFPDSGVIEDYAALGITCAACVRSDDLLDSINNPGRPNLTPPLTYYAGMYQNQVQPRMDSLELGELIEYLLEEARQGYAPLTWNGASYDFRMLAEALPEYRDQIRDNLVFPGYDMMFHFFSCSGHFLGLDTACKGQGISGKNLDPILKDGSSMNGQKAVGYWPEHYEAVLEYVSNDVVVPVLLAQKVTEQKGLLSWTARSGRLTSLSLNQVKGHFSPFQQEFRWLTVAECLALPSPDQSWMSDPVTKEDFLAYWL